MIAILDQNPERDLLKHAYVFSEHKQTVIDECEGKREKFFRHVVLVKINTLSLIRTDQLCMTVWIRKVATQLNSLKPK